MQVSTKPKFNVTVRLTGEDGNAFAIMAQVRKAIISAGANSDQVAQFLTEAMSGNYDNLLRTCCRWVNVI